MSAPSPRFTVSPVLRCSSAPLLPRPAAPPLSPHRLVAVSPSPRFSGSPVHRLSGSPFPFGGRSVRWPRPEPIAAVGASRVVRTPGAYASSPRVCVTAEKRNQSLAESIAYEPNGFGTFFHSASGYPGYPRRGSPPSSYPGALPAPEAGLPPASFRVSTAYCPVPFSPMVPFFCFILVLCKGVVDATAANDLGHCF